jgi:hypothetical protein
MVHDLSWKNSLIAKKYIYYLIGLLISEFNGHLFVYFRLNIGYKK